MFSLRGCKSCALDLDYNAPTGNIFCIAGFEGLGFSYSDCSFKPIQLIIRVAWLAWMSDLVLEDIRGTYFGKRNMITSACSMVAVLLGFIIGFFVGHKSHDW